MLCKFMALAYEDELFITSQLPSYAKLVYHMDGTSIVYFTEYNVLVLCFAGTKAESLKDWWINITGTHQQEWKKQRTKVIEALKKYEDAYMIVCCHSKGV